MKISNGIKKIQTSKQTNKREGIISISSRGTGYVAIPELKEDPEIDFRHLNTALHGDTVGILLHPKNLSTHKRQTAEVTRIISRAKIGFAGVMEIEKSMFFVKPDDTKMYTDILVPPQMLNGAKEGQKVFVEIVSWKDSRKAPEGKIIKILGLPGDNDTEMHSIAMEKGFDSDFPLEVEREASIIKARGIKNEDLKDRKDFRKILTFTIDPIDAKDFDDAISFRQLSENECEVGIHIADVSHYLKIGSELDEEARSRGTSVYLVDRTIPMLPEALSNELCSLVPNQDRLTMSAIFVVDKNAKIKNEWFGRTVIHSQKRFTYEEAEKVIHNPSSPLHKELSILNSLAKKLNKERFANGALVLEQEEIKFVLDKSGVPIKVMKKERGDSNKLIEEFMLLANKKVAEVFSKKENHRGNKKEIKKEIKHGHPTQSVEEVFVYRIHDLPSKEKMEDLAFFLKSLGHKVTLQNGNIPTYQINNILAKLAVEDKAGTMKDTVHRAVIRSMAKAIYSTKNIGHYGLAFNSYTNFTSPIRRYPDVIVHRLLMDKLEGIKIPKDKLLQRAKIYEAMMRTASDQEKRATDAERSSVKYKQVEYMSLRIDQKFEGIISGMSEWGIYVEEVETKCEGLVRVRDMSDDFYVFNEKKLELVGQKKKKRYRLGDRVKIKVKGVDLDRKTIDYALI